MKQLALVVALMLLVGLSARELVKIHARLDLLESRLLDTRLSQLDTLELLNNALHLLNN